MFVEVKSRSSNDYGEAVEAVDRAKRRKLLRAAEAYLSERDIKDKDIRFDVITVKSRMILIQIDHPEVGVIEIGDARFLDGERDDVEQYGLESAQFFQFHGITSCHDHYCLFFDKRKVLTSV